MTGSQKSVWRNSVQHETKDFKIILEVLWVPASPHLSIEVWQPDENIMRILCQLTEKHKVKE